MIKNRGNNKVNRKLIIFNKEIINKGRDEEQLSPNSWHPIHRLVNINTELRRDS